MEHWVRIYSEFTPEALFFEALGILVFCALYSAYWVVSKRRLGPLGQQVPTGVVRTYLNQLVVDAEMLRGQLFGLLADTGATPRAITGTSASAGAPAGATTTVVLNDPDAQKKLAALEQKLAEQNLALTTLNGDKAKLEAELGAAKAKAGAGASSSDNGEAEKLKKKIKELEDRLAEYSVIEDDLANLKRLQQENNQLKTQLSLGGGAAAAGAVAATAAAAPTPDPAADLGEGPDAGIGGGPEATDMKLSPVNEDGVAAEPAAPKAGGEDAFEGLVDEVEKSLGSPDPAGASAAAIVTEAGTAAGSAAAPAAGGEAAAGAGGAETSPLEGMGKGDEDLLAEFEKMLNS